MGFDFEKLNLVLIKVINFQNFKWFIPHQFDEKIIIYNET